MGQDDIYKFLEKRKGQWFSRVQIMEGVKLGSSTTSNAIAKLLKWGEIERKVTNESHFHNIYMSLYRVP